MNQVSRNEELLNTARDYFQFATKFFEPINSSATHIYHSALELSPLPSIIRRLYHHRRHTPSPRLIVGNQDLWGQGLTASCKYSYGSCAWSPCGRFIAAWNGEGVETRDPLSFELFSTLVPTTIPTQQVMTQLAYSMDGRSVAFTCDTLLIIWDTQTGGVAKKKEFWSDRHVCLAWSLDGSTIGIISSGNPKPGLYTVYEYDLASGEMRSPGTLRSADKPYLWAHDTSFRVMTTTRDDQGCLINISEVEFVLTEIESFHIRLRMRFFAVVSFSQTTYRISISDYSHHYFVFDARTSRRLLEGDGLRPHCFSPDGSLFAGISVTAVHIWKYTSDNYTPWRKFSLQNLSLDCDSLQFSPTSSLLLARSKKSLHLWRLDDPPIIPHPGHRTPPLIALSQCGSYMATGRRTDSIVTITNLLSQTSSHPIDTGMAIDELALTGNVLLVLDSTTIAAWRLTEEGAVDGVFADRRAGRDDSIWTVSLLDEPRFSVEDQTVTIRQKEEVIHAYRTETGEILEPARTFLHHRHKRTSWYTLHRLQYSHYHGLDPVSRSTIQMGWVKDPEGKHRLWIPVEWRHLISAASPDDDKVLLLDLGRGGSVLIKF